MNFDEFHGQEDKDSNQSKTKTRPAGSRSSQKKSGSTGFDSFITPKLIKMLFVVGLIAIVIFSLMQIAGGMERLDDTYQSGGKGLIFSGVGLLLFGSIAWRVSCELMMVVFSINDNLIRIRRNQRQED